MNKNMKQHQRRKLLEKNVLGEYTSPLVTKMREAKKELTDEQFQEYINDLINTAKKPT